MLFDCYSLLRWLCEEYDLAYANVVAIVARVWDGNPAAFPGGLMLYVRSDGASRSWRSR